METPAKDGVCKNLLNDKNNAEDNSFRALNSETRFFRKRRHIATLSYHTQFYFLL